MSVQQEIQQYLSECGVFYFATVNGDAPVVRPLGFSMEREGQLYLGVGTFKDVYAQLSSNPHVYICACKPDGSGWIRVAGKAVCDADPALVDATFEAMPDLKALYESNGWEMGVFHLEDATATWVDGPMTPVRTETF
ncbi:MAG: pyridoxamine 5'-phosphate oxidase family protein [Eggerthellaceae bacterium]|nr:pyridoxamine 5'-phosphate oxidase family protein [Eggerthellaceae bacterium]